MARIGGCRASFIFPAFVIVTVLAWLYVRFGTTPAAQSLLYGIQPVVIAIILQAIWVLGRKAITGWFPRLIAAAVFGLYFLNINELLLLLGGGIVFMLAANGWRLINCMRKVEVVARPRCWCCFPVGRRWSGSSRNGRTRLPEPVILELSRLGRCCTVAVTS
ncbi:MAG: chromate transporter [Chloroflexota bacterium]